MVEVLLLEIITYTSCEGSVDDTLVVIINHPQWGYPTPPHPPCVYLSVGIQLYLSVGDVPARDDLV